MNENKRGNITISYRFFRDHSDAVLRLFLEIKFLPLRVEHDMFGDIVTYSGLSESFRELPKGGEAPAYRALCEAGENNEIKKIWVEEAK